ncbi:MAG: hypothetical protein JNL04_22375 [Rhodospirillaceae bacterium]|nr:hypothetical protein [Rhodospirillaceae bacterium]
MALLARAEALNGGLNAICTLTADQARGRARKAEAAVMKGKKLGPLHRIPITLKDVLFIKAVKTMAGSHIFANRAPDLDSPTSEYLQAPRTFEKARPRTQARPKSSRQFGDAVEPQGRVAR